jgi:hypothetical protein
MALGDMLDRFPDVRFGSIESGVEAAFCSRHDDVAGAP